MGDQIRISRTASGATVTVNVTAVHNMMDSLVKESIADRLRRCGEQVKERGHGNVPARKQEMSL